MSAEQIQLIAAGFFLCAGLIFVGWGVVMAFVLLRIKRRPRPKGPPPPEHPNFRCRLVRIENRVRRGDPVYVNRPRRSHGVYPES